MGKRTRRPGLLARLLRSTRRRRRRKSTGGAKRLGRRRVAAGAIGWVAERRSLLTVVGTAFAVLILVGLGVSCLTTRRGENEDPAGDPLLLGFPGDQPSVRVDVVPGAERATIAVGGPYRLIDPGAGAEAPGARLEAASVEAPAAGGLAIGSLRYGSDVLKVVPDGVGTPVVVEGRRYHGALTIHRLAAGKVAIVNRVGLEDYLAGVIGAEMPLGWPDSALHAQAVAARTYALYHLRKKGGAGRFDVRADTRSQVYRGLDYDTDAQRRRAAKLVRETSGVVLAWRDRIFQAFFHSSCGGRTTSALAYFGAPDITPLSGARCGFCDASKYTNWEVALPAAELVARLRERGHAAPDVLADVRVVGHDAAGRAEEVALVGGGTAEARDSITMPASAFRLSVGASRVRSTWFEVAREENGAGPAQVVLRGHGWGHGVGLCQWGARGMAKDGYAAEGILRRYYPGAQIVRAYGGSDDADAGGGEGGAARDGGS